MVYGIGLGMTVLLKNRERFFYNNEFKKVKKNENRKAGKPGIVQTGVRT